MVIVVSDMNMTTLMQEKGSSKEGVNELFSQCVPKNKCLKFVVMNPNGAAVWLSITRNSTIVYQQVVNDILQTVKIGDCSITSCPQSQTLFEFDIITDNYPSEFSWKLMDSSNFL